MFRAHLERISAPANVQQEVVSGLGDFVAFQTPAAPRCSCAQVKAWAQLVVRQSFVVKAEPLRAKLDKEKCRQRTLESAQVEYEAMDARSFVVAVGLKRLTTEDEQRWKPAPYADQSSALGSLLVEREDMQHAYSIKVRPNSGKKPGVLRAKTSRTSRQSSLTSKSGRSTSRASQRSARSQASVASKASRRARSTVGSRRGSSNVHQKNRTGKGKGRGRGSNKGRDNSNKGKAPGSKNGKGHNSSRNPS